MLAVHEETGNPVAIKYLSRQLTSDEIFLGRFRAEAHLMAGLDDPHLVRFYEYVETPQAAALVMELVDGVTLAEILKSEGATGPEAALVVLKGSLRGLAAAHEIGVVHRDYKPGNVLVSADGNSKLGDFGIAVRTGEGAAASGTPAYMAPEQWESGTVTPAIDVSAATAVFFECLTGHRPFQVKGLWAMAAAHRTEPVPVNEVPGGLRDLVAHGMAKHPLDRPPSADAFLAELEATALAGYGPGWEERGRVRLAALAALLAALFPSAEPLTTAGTALGLTRLGRGRGRLITVAGAVAGALVAGSGGAYVMASVHHHITPTSATSSPSAALGPTTTPTPTPTNTPPPTPTPTDPTTIPTTTPTSPTSGTTAIPADGPTTKPPTKPPTHKPPKPTAKVTGLKVTSVTVTATKEGLAADGYHAVATVYVSVSGTGSVQVDATFSSPVERSAARQTVTGSQSVTFSANVQSCLVNVLATASPPATQATGQGSCRAQGTAK